jgi:8-oxo-dGTP pyrophosphatase MutT (NUDIX family)
MEIPEGGGPIGIDPLVSAKRELKEETGFEADNWTKILEMHLSNSVSDELSIIYLATSLTYGIAEPEDTEELELIKMSFDEAYRKVLQHEITDAMTVAAILKLKIMFLEKEISNA